MATSRTRSRCDTGLHRTTWTTNIAAMTENPTPAKRLPPKVDVQGLLESLGLACAVPEPVPPALLGLLSGVVCEFKCNTAVNRMYRWNGAKMERVVELPQVRVLDPSTQVLSSGHTAVGLRALMPDAPNGLRLEQLRYLLFEKGLVPLAKPPWPEVLNERCFWCCDATRTCWPLADKHFKHQLGPVLVTKAPSQKRHLDVCETATLEQRRRDVEAWLTQEGLLTSGTGTLSIKAEPPKDPPKETPKEPKPEKKEQKLSEKKPKKAKKEKEKRKKDKDKEKKHKSKSKSKSKSKAKKEKAEKAEKKEEKPEESGKRKRDDSEQTEKEAVATKRPKTEKTPKPPKQPKQPKNTPKEPEPLSLESIFKRPASDDVLDNRYALVCEEFDRLFVTYEGAETFEQAAHRAMMRGITC